MDRFFFASIEECFQVIKPVGTGTMILAGVEYAFPASPWVMIFGPICIILGVCASLLVPLRSQLCFLDMTSIHQSNPKLLERGIYGIGGFLSVSKELRVLYTPPYFTSLWLNSTESLIHMEIEQRYKKHIKKTLNFALICSISWLLITGGASSRWWHFAPQIQPERWHFCHCLLHKTFLWAWQQILF